MLLSSSTWVEESSDPGPVASLVNVTGGSIQGEDLGDGLKRWQGIPYAAPPVGDLRWRAPQPVIPWEGVRQATEPGPTSVQAQGPQKRT